MPETSPTTGRKKIEDERNNVFSLKEGLSRSIGDDKSSSQESDNAEGRVEDSEDEEQFLKYRFRLLSDRKKVRALEEKARVLMAEKEAVELDLEHMRREVLILTAEKYAFDAELERLRGECRELTAEKAKVKDLKDQVFGLTAEKDAVEAEFDHMRCQEDELWTERAIVEDLEDKFSDVMADKKTLEKACDRHCRHADHVKQSYEERIVELQNLIEILKELHFDWLAENVEASDDDVVHSKDGSTKEGCLQEREGGSARVEDMQEEAHRRKGRQKEIVCKNSPGGDHDLIARLIARISRACATRTDIRNGKLPCRRNLKIPFDNSNSSVEKTSVDVEDESKRSSEISEKPIRELRTKTGTRSLVEDAVQSSSDSKRMKDDPKKKRNAKDLHQQENFGNSPSNSASKLRRVLRTRQDHKQHRFDTCYSGF
ncbi:unnamed protein product [Calypogeia fissa]